METSSTNPQPDPAQPQQPAQPAPDQAQPVPSDPRLKGRNIIWHRVTESAGARPPQPQQRTRKPVPSDIIWAPLDKAPPPTQPDDWHVMKAVTRGFLRSWGEMTGDRPEEIAAREQTLGIQRRSAKGDKAAEFAGGVLAPQPGMASEGAGFAASRLADKAKKTLGQITGWEPVQRFEQALARLPGGGFLRKAIKSQQEQLGNESEDLVNRLAGGADTSASGAGNVVNSQLKEAVKRIKRNSAEMFTEVDKLIPPAKVIGVKGTLSRLRELTAPIPGAENVSEHIVDPTILSIREGLEKDLTKMNMDALPYEAVSKLRTKIGKMVKWTGVFSTDPRNGQLKQVYEALTADLGTGASSTSDAAAAAVRRANAEYALGKQQEKALKAVVDKAGGPEKVFASLMSGTKEGATTITQVLNNVDGPSRQIIAASALERMGRATDGMQNAAGDVFSASTFLTNWNRMSQEARSALFGQLPGDYAKNVTQLATNVESLKSYERVMANPSGTAHALLWSSAIDGTLLALFTGHWHVAAGVVGMASTTSALSAALTNPKTTAWLAQRTGELVISAAKGEMGTTPQAHQAWITREARQGKERQAVEQFDESLGL